MINERLKDIGKRIQRTRKEKGYPYWVALNIYKIILMQVQL